MSQSAVSFVNMAGRSRRSKILEGLAESEVSKLPDVQGEHFSEESCEGLGQESEPAGDI
jgi:hypothetical protein